MDIRINEVCLQQLLIARPTADKCLRISAEHEGGGCGCMISVGLRWDERRLDDVYAVADSLCVVLDQPTRMLLDATWYDLDFRANLGYILKSSQETVAYGIRFTN